MSQINETPVKAFYKVNALIGPECNLNCSYCMIHDRKEQPPYSGLSYEFIKKVVKANLLSFSDAEPMLHKSTIYRIIELIPPSLSIQIQTNGTFITDKDIEIFNEKDIEVIISWDGHEMSLKHRKYDAFATSKLLQIKHLSIEATLVESCSLKLFLEDLYYLQEQYEKIWPGCFISFNLNLIDKIKQNIGDSSCLVEAAKHNFDSALGKAIINWFARQISHSNILIKESNMTLDGKEWKICRENVNRKIIPKHMNEKIDYIPCESCTMSYLCTPPRVIDHTFKNECQARKNFWTPIHVFLKKGVS